MSQPVQLFTVIVLVSLPTVMFGGYSLLRLMKTEQLSAFQLTYFRAGHAHAGVLLVMALATLSFLDRADLGSATRWIVCILLALGVIAQSGGMFLHMMVGQQGRWSIGNTVTVAGAVALAVALLTVAYGVATA
jgi:heme/copper-type cytochrome/quinol oxidase subunit 4